MKKARSGSGSPTRRAVGRPASRSRRGRRTVLLTGYPGFIGKFLVRKLVQEEPESTFFLLVQEKFTRDAEKYIRSLNAGKSDRVHLLVGDIANMHLGLSAEELKSLVRKVTDIYHLAAVSYLGIADREMWRVNVQGSINLLEVAEETHHLKRFNHVSTCYVSGDRMGVILEDELDEGQRFRNQYEATKFEAEKRVRENLPRLPISIYRPSIVVGDSKTGQIGRFDGPYNLGVFLAASPVTGPLPLPGKGHGPLNIIPVDYLVDALYVLSLHPEAVGKTFHLVDPNPLSARKVYETVAARTGKKPPAMIPFTAGFTRTLLRIPGLEKITRFHRQAIDYFNAMAFYNSGNTEAMLRGSGIACPPFNSYLDNLLSYVRSTYAKQQEEQAEDPLA